MRNAMKIKEEKKRWLHFYNRILSGVLVLLGFNACDGTGADEYGTPYCRFEIKGKVLDELREPVKDARVIVKELTSDGEPMGAYYTDTLYTQENGEFRFLNEQAGGYGKYRLVCEDSPGIYKADSTDIKMEPTGGKGWYQGSDTKEVYFVLKKKNE